MQTRPLRSGSFPWGTLVLTALLVGWAGLRRPDGPAGEGAVRAQEPPADWIVLDHPEDGGAAREAGASGGSGQPIEASAPADSSTAPAGSSTAPAGSSTAPAGSSTAPAGSSTAPAGPPSVPAPGRLREQEQ